MMKLLVKKLKTNKRFRPFCSCPPDVMFVTRGSKTLSFLSLILFPTWIAFNYVNYGSTKVIQWVPRRHKVLTHRLERLFRKITSVSIHSFVEWFSLSIFYFLKCAKKMRHKLNKRIKSSPIYNKLQHYLIEHACI